MSKRARGGGKRTRSLQAVQKLLEDGSANGRGCGFRIGKLLLRTSVTAMYPLGDFVECLPAAVTRSLEQGDRVFLSRLLARADAMTTKSIHGPGRESAELDRAPQCFKATAMPREHQRNCLRSDAKLCGNLSERVAKPAQHRDFADTLGNGVEISGCCRG